MGTARVLVIFGWIECYFDQYAALSGFSTP